MSVNNALLGATASGVGTNPPANIDVPDPGTWTPESNTEWDAVAALVTALGATGVVWDAAQNGSVNVNDNGGAVADGEDTGWVANLLNPTQAALTASGAARPSWHSSVSGLAGLRFDGADERMLITPSQGQANGWFGHVIYFESAADANQTICEIERLRVEARRAGLTGPWIRLADGDFKSIDGGSIQGVWAYLTGQYALTASGTVLYRRNGEEWQSSTGATMTNGASYLGANNYNGGSAWCGMVSHRGMILDKIPTHAQRATLDAWMLKDTGISDITPADPDAPPASQGDYVELVDTPLRTVNVSNGTEFAAALADATPGDRISLANGTYSGTYATSAAGTAANPVEIVSASGNGATITGTLTFNHDYYTIRRVNTGGSSTTYSIDASYVRVLRCTLGSTAGRKVQIERDINNTNCEIAWCYADGGGFSIITILVPVNYTGAVRPNHWVHHNNLRNGGSVVELGSNNTHSITYMGVLVEYNLVFQAGDNTALGSKSSGNIFYRNTLRDCSVGGNDGTLQIRHGRYCKLIANTCIRSRGAFARGVGHEVIGNWKDDYVTGAWNDHGAAGGTCTWADFQAGTSGSNIHPACQDSLFIGNIENSTTKCRVGGGSSLSTVPASNNTVEATSSITYGPGPYSGTTVNATASQTVPAYIAGGLSDSDVGIDADWSSGASYRWSDTATAEQLAAKPFNSASAFHRPIGTGATYADDSHASRIAWVAVVPANNGQSGGGTIGAINQGNPFGVASMYASASDPLRTVRRRNCTDTAESALNWDPGGSNVQIRIPDSNGVNTVVGNQCFENTSFIVQSDYSTYEFFQTNRNGTDYRASICRVADIRGLGHGSALGDRVGVSASGCSVRMGMLSAAALLAEQEIGHALKLAIYSGTGSEAHELLSRSIQWPACNADSFASNPANNNGPIPYGALLAIPQTTDLSTLGLTTPQGYILGRAMQYYGCYVMDDANGIVLRADGSLGGTATAIVADYRKLLRHLRMVLNSVTGATASIAADGGYNQTGDIGDPTYPAGGGSAIALNTALVTA